MPVHYELGARPDAEHVVLITLDRPEAKNACDLEHFHQLAQAWKRFESDDAAWVAIFTGVGRSFMSGADLKTYVPEITALAKELKAGTATSVKGYSLSDGTDAVLRGTKIYKPIIAAVNGPCVAGGMEMLGGVDIRIAARARDLRCAGARTGPVRRRRHHGAATPPDTLRPGDGVPAVRGSDRRSACVSTWVYSMPWSPRKRCWTSAFEYAARITKNAPLAIQATKRSALEGLKLDMREAYRNESRISREVFATEDAKEGPRAFAEKRTPRWSGS